MKFLLIRYSSLGDVILTTSVVKVIKENKPDSTIDILTKEEYKPVFQNNPDINCVLTGISRRIKYDYIIDLHNSIRSNIVKYFIPAKERLIYNNAAYARRLYLHGRHRTEILKKSVIDRYSEPLAGIGFNVRYMQPEVTVTAREMEDAKNISTKKHYIAIAPGAKWRTKQWVIENNISLVIKIIRELNMEVVLLGGVKNTALANEIVKGVGLLRSHVVDLTGKTGIRELAAVIKGSAMLVSTDSAPMHLGWAVGTKVVALYGPTVREFGFQPQDEKVSIIEKDMECRPCSLHGSRICKYKDRACMQRIEVHEVFDEIRKFL